MIGPSFNVAFLKLQKSLRPVKRNAVGDDGKPYADIEAIWTHIRPKLARHGFIIIQSEGVDTVETVLRQVESAEYFAFTVRTSPDGKYGRRHALMCLLGIVEEPLPTSDSEVDAGLEVTRSFA